MQDSGQPPMISHLYRFRSAGAVLDDYHELERGEIYLPSTRELNDPMEGYKDLYWSGDRIVWRNCLKHYVLCLLLSIPLCVGTDPKFDEDDIRLIIFNTPSDLPIGGVTLALFKAVYEDFLSDQRIEAFLNSISARVTPVRRSELTGYLRTMHPYAIGVITRKLMHPGILPISGSDAPLDYLGKFLELGASDAAKAEEMFSISDLADMVAALMHAYSTNIPPEAKAWEFLVRSFPAAYVNALEELVHPPGHAACFVANPSDASMWGTYGDGHRGVCLKFKTSPDSSGRPALPLYTAVGMGGDMKIFYQYVPHAFWKVSYSQEYPEIDFFRSIGRLPIPKLNSCWYVDETGARSSCLNDVRSDEAAWRAQYWQAFQSGAIQKTREWAHEQEYRLVYSSDGFDLREKSSRKLRYKFSDLSGIIFGTQTTAEHKEKIMRIIGEKCKAEGRQDFDFYQLRYSRARRQFELGHLSALRLTS